MSNRDNMVHEERLIKQISFLQEAIQRLDKQEETSLDIARNINRKTIPDANKLMINTTGNREESKKLVNSLKRLLLELNDPEGTYPKLVSLYLTDVLLSSTDALHGHFSNYEDIILQNIVSTVQNNSNLKSKFFGNLRKRFKDNVRID